MRIDRLEKGRDILFYIALIIECVAVIIDKSRLTNPYTTYLFRGTAVLFLIVLLLTEYTAREWALIALAIGLGIASYLYTGRDEIVRVAVMIAACRSMSLKRTMGVAFFTTLAGCLLLVILALIGIFGEVSVTHLYRLQDGVTTRYTLGFGHPNALQCMFYMLMLMGMYLFDRYLRWYLYLVLLVMTLGMYFLTDSRTGLLLGVFSILLSVVLHYPVQDDPGRDEVARFQARSLGRYFLDIGLRSKKVSYLCGGLAVLASVAGSVYAAVISGPMGYHYGEPDYAMIWSFDNALNNRISNLYWTDGAHAGSIETWKPMSDRMSEQFFDMGWVRLFYWYGIIPAVIAIILILFLLAECYRRRDAQALMLIVSLSLYTIIEAHLVSIYIGRNFLLLLFGAYWSSMLFAEKGEGYYLPELVRR